MSILIAEISYSKHIIFLAIMAVAFNGVCFAQVRTIDKNAPVLNTEVSAISTDNLNPTVSPKSQANGLAVGLSGQLVTTGEGNWLMFNYDGKFERYKLSDSQTLPLSKYDFSSYKGTLLGRFFVSNAWYVDTQLMHEKADEKFGFGLSNLRNDVFIADERTQNQASIDLVYGSDTTSRSISVKLSSSDVQYADINSYSTLFNYTQNSLDVNVSFRQSSLTQWLLNFEAEDDNYDSDLRDDSRLFRLLMGVDWRPSGKSKLKALIGVYQRRQSNEETSSGLSWNIDYEYQPRQDILLNLRSSRLSDIGKSELTSDSVNSSLAVNLSYLYSRQWQLGAYFDLVRSEYEDLLFTQILDENIAKLWVKLVLKEHSTLSLDIMAREVSSNDDSVDYQQNEARLTWHYIF